MGGEKGACCRDGSPFFSCLQVRGCKHFFMHGHGRNLRVLKRIMVLNLTMGYMGHENGNKSTLTVLQLEDK